jgi:hypothetical protein
MHLFLDTHKKLTPWWDLNSGLQFFRYVYAMTTAPRRQGVHQKSFCKLLCKCLVSSNKLK